MKLKDVLKLSDVHIISINGENIGHTMEVIDVSHDDNHYPGINEIVRFKFQQTDIAYYYEFNTNEIVHEHPAQIKHTYIIESCLGFNVPVEIAICKKLPLHPV